MGYDYRNNVGTFVVDINCDVSISGKGQYQQNC